MFHVQSRSGFEFFGLADSAFPFSVADEKVPVPAGHVVCGMCFAEFHIDTRLNILLGLPLQEPGLRWPDTAGNSANSPFHHDDEDSDLKGIDEFSGGFNKNVGSERKFLVYKSFLR